MDRNHTVKPLCLLIDGPILFRANMFVETIGRDHRADHAQFFNGPAQLSDSRGNILHRDQGHRFKARAEL